MKKTLSLFLSLVMLLSTLSFADFSSFAAGSMNTVSGYIVVAENFGMDAEKHSCFTAENQYPVKDVKIEAVDEHGNKTTAYTDKNGFFRMRVTEGLYDFTATYIFGYDLLFEDCYIDCDYFIDHAPIIACNYVKDGKIDTKDNREWMLMRKRVNNNEGTEDDMRADTTGDGIVDINDKITLLNIWLGIQSLSIITENLDDIYSGYIIPKNNIYNLGEETYGFANYSDSDSSGHCFGMSITSAGYYTGCLNRSIISNTTSTLYSLSATASVKKPICKYQPIQGSYRDTATVAGGSYYLTGSNNISSDWDEVINYVKNHNYDNRGNLQIGFRKDHKGGHAVNFLYYKEVDGQQRIYAYDNNFPNTETYFYKASDGNVYQAPKYTLNGAIDCIALRDVYKYYQSAAKYDASLCIYAEKGALTIEGAKYVSPMECAVGYGDLMYEFEKGTETAEIVPEGDEATFTYLDKKYTFNKTEDDTYAVLTVHNESEDSDNDVVIMSESKGVICDSHDMVETRVEPTCTEDGSVTKKCSECGFSKTELIPCEGHNYTVQAVEPTCTENGSITKKCTKCDFTTTTVIDAEGHTVVIDKAVEPTFTAKGKTEGKHCSVCGKVLTVQTAIAKLGAPSLRKVKKGRKRFTATWKAISGVEGYQIQYSRKKNMKKSKKVTVKNPAATKKVVKKLKKGKKYYVRIRAYKTINGKLQYSSWSKKKAVKVK